MDKRKKKIKKKRGKDYFINPTKNIQARIYKIILASKAPQRWLPTHSKKKSKAKEKKRKEKKKGKKKK